MQPRAMVGSYHLEEMLGRGGMGAVYRAYDTRRERWVALKLLAGEVARDPEYRERFRREARLAARLSSPHVIPIHDFGVVDDSLFIDMRLCAGTDLGKLIARGPLDPARAVEIVSQLAEALDVAHESGMVHRDVKPANVMVESRDDRDFVYLVDFGIVRGLDGSGSAVASLTATGAFIGTLSYMAPELFTSESPPTPSVDVYALGCVLYEAVVGRPAFAASTMGALIHQHMTAPPPRPSGSIPGVPPGIDDVVARALAKDPAGRPRTAGELAGAARRALRSDARPGTSARPSATPTWTPTWTPNGPVADRPRTPTPQHPRAAPKPPDPDVRVSPRGAVPPGYRAPTAVRRATRTQGGVGRGMMIVFGIPALFVVLVVVVVLAVTLGH